MVLSKCHATLFPPISLVGSSGASLAPVHSFGNALAPAGSTVAASLIGPHLPEPCPAGLALLAFDSQPLAWWPYLPCRMTDNKQNNNHTGHHGIIPQHTISHPVLGSLRWSWECLHRNNVKIQSKEKNKQLYKSKTMCMTIHGNPCLALGLGSWLGQTLHGLHGLGWLLQEHACERTTNSFFVSLDGLHCLHGFECLHGLHGRLGLGLCSHMHGKAQFKKEQEPQHQ